MILRPAQRLVITAERDDYIKRKRLRELPRAGAQSNTQKRFGRCCRGMAGAGLFFGVRDACATDGLTCGTMRASCACPAPLVRRQRSWSVIVEASLPRRNLSQRPANRSPWLTTNVRPSKERAPFLTRRDRAQQSLVAVTETPSKCCRARSERDEVAERIWIRRREEPPRRRNIHNPTRRAIRQITNAGLMATAYYDKRRG
jgi:hypothetical protein